MSCSRASSRKGVCVVDLRLHSLYVGPDQMMPVASILAAAMGFLLVFWNKLLGLIRKVFHLAPPPEPPETTSSTAPLPSTTAPAKPATPDEKPKHS